MVTAQGVVMQALYRVVCTSAGQTVGIGMLGTLSGQPVLRALLLGYFGDETYGLEPLANPFGPKVLPMSPV